MTEQNPPVFLQSGGSNAEDVRRMVGALVSDRAGILDVDNLLVTAQTTPDMTVSVAGGRAFVPGTQGTYQGVYFIDNRGSGTATITASDAALDRIDLVVARVRDAAYLSNEPNTWSLAVVKGTNAAPGSAVAPAAPANSITLARVLVAHGVTTIQSSAITDVRPAVISASGGFIVCTSTTRPTTRRQWRPIFETDTKSARIWDGTYWRPIDAPHLGAGVKASRTFTGSASTFDVGSANLDAGWIPIQDSGGYITNPNGNASAAITIPAGQGGVYAITYIFQFGQSPTARAIGILNFDNNGATAPILTDAVRTEIGATQKGGTVSVTLPLADGATIRPGAWHDLPTTTSKTINVWLYAYRLGG